MTDIRASLLVSEAIERAIASARASDLAAKALTQNDPPARVSAVQDSALVGMTPPPPRLSAAWGSALTVADIPPRMSGLMIEVLVSVKENYMPLVYPDLPGLTYTVTWEPQFFNLQTQTTASGADIDLALASTPLHNFELVYNFLRDRALPSSEFRTLMGFFMAARGQVGRFLFRNPDDNYIQGQYVTTTDGSSYTYGPLERTFGYGDASSTEPVGYVDLTQPFDLYLNGVWQDPSTYEILQGVPVNQQIRFTYVPAAGLSITVDMGYYYYCKFSEDVLSFEKFMHQLWEVKHVRLRSCRPGA